MLLPKYYLHGSRQVSWDSGPDRGQQAVPVKTRCSGLRGARAPSSPLSVP